MTQKKTRKAANYWGKTLPYLPETFYGFPPLRDYFCRCILGEAFHTWDAEMGDTGAPETWFIDILMHDKVPVDSCLSICCGFGHVERSLAKRGVFKHCIGLDLSEGAIKTAKEKAREEGFENIEYKIADMNRVSLVPEAFDLIYAVGALHHLTELEHISAEIFKALKPGGTLICNEYVGPNYQKIACRQREIINAVIHLLPSRLRYVNEDTFVPSFWNSTRWRRALYELGRTLHFKSPSLDVDSTRPQERWSRLERWFYAYCKLIKRLPPYKAKTGTKFRFGKVWDETSAATKNTDPSECVRSSKIIAVLKDTFRDIDIRFYNGSILFYALENKFYRRFDNSSERDRALLEMLLNIEETMIRIGELEPDHAQIIARKPL